MNEITRTLNLQVKERPKLPFNDSLKVQAYDKLVVDMPRKADAGPGQARVNVQSGDLEDIELILITCGDRPKDAKRLYYRDASRVATTYEPPCIRADFICHPALVGGLCRHSGGRRLLARAEHSCEKR